MEGMPGERYRQLREWCAALCPDVTPTLPPRADLGYTDHECTVLDWAASGAMALTGFPDRPPVTSPAPAFALLAEVLRVFGRLAGEIGASVQADPGVILAGRAGVLGLSRAGQTSAGGATRLLRAADGWCAITLSRPTDFDAVPAILSADVSDDPWQALADAARTARGRGTELVERCRLLGVPAATLPAGPTSPAHQAVDPAPPFRITRIAAPDPSARLAGALVVDLSAMWAGPLCAHLLGQAGARVVKVESSSRPDGARRGDPRFFGWLHEGHEQVALDFHSPEGRTALANLLAEADVVIEASRPRALGQLGLAPQDIPHRPGQVWLSITGYGRDEPGLVAFGDDAAVAGGLVGWSAGEPVFCADAVADPLTGACAALAVAGALLGGGGVLIDLSMRAVAATFASASARGAATEHSPHFVHRAGDEWRVYCPWLGRHQVVLPPPLLPASAEIGAAC